MSLADGIPFAGRKQNRTIYSHTEAAYLSNNKLYVTQAEILTGLIESIRVFNYNVFIRNLLIYVKDLSQQQSLEPIQKNDQTPASKRTAVEK